MQAVDEHGLRTVIALAPASQPLRHLVIAVGDRPFDPEGFWPADVTLFTTVIGLDRLEVLATEAVLAGGFLDRVRHAFVEIEEGEPATAEATPTLIVPESRDHALVFAYRDREDELEGVARRLKHDAAARSEERRVGKECRSRWARE